MDKIKNVSETIMKLRHYYYAYHENHVINATQLSERLIALEDFQRMWGVIVDQELDDMFKYAKKEGEIDE